MTMTGLWPVMVTHLGSRGFISWPPEALLFMPTLTMDGLFFEPPFHTTPLRYGWGRLLFFMRLPS